MNLRTMGMRDGATVELISVRTEEAVDSYDDLTWKDLGHRKPYRANNNLQTIGIILPFGIGTVARFGPYHGPK